MTKPDLPVPEGANEYTAAVPFVDQHGTRWTLRYTWNAISELQTAFGLETDVLQVLKRGKLDELAIIVAAGLREAHPDITPEKVRELSPPLVPVTQAITLAVMYAHFGPGDDKGPERPQERPPEPGRKAGRGLLRRWAGRFASGSNRPNSGG